MIKNTFKKSAFALAALAAIGGGAGVSAVASAQTSNTNPPSTTGNQTSGPQNFHRIGPGIMGTVASISGHTITVTGKNATTYTVDATNAKFFKKTADAQLGTVTIADVAVGDALGVRGAVTGTSVVATEVIDGVGSGIFRGHRGPGKGLGVMGTVSAINGNTLTVTKPDGKTYTVDASNAKVSKVVDLSVSGIKVGDHIGVEGAITGTSVVASHIMDGSMPMVGNQHSLK